MHMDKIMWSIMSCGIGGGKHFSVFNQIKKKYSHRSAAEEEKAFLDGLMKFITRSGFFRRGPNNDGHLDSDIIQTISKMLLTVNCGYNW